MKYRIPSHLPIKCAYKLVLQGIGAEIKTPKFFINVSEFALGFGGTLVSSIKKVGFLFLVKSLLQYYYARGFIKINLLIQATNFQEILRTRLRS